MKNVNSPIYFLYNDQVRNISGTCWAKRINSVIDHLGFNEIRHNFSVNVNYFAVLKQRLCDQYIQEWKACINNLPKLAMYCRFKKTFEFEEYINAV